MRRSILVCALLSLLTNAGAQRIDINNTTNWAEERLTETGFTAWPIGTTTQATITVNGITITAIVDGGSAQRTLKGNWWKDGVQKYSRLVGDGLCVYGWDGNNTPQIQSGAVGITLTISGLSAGEHSLLAYHNNTDGYTGPVLDVVANGQQLLQGGTVHAFSGKAGILIDPDLLLRHGGIPIENIPLSGNRNTVRRLLIRADAAIAVYHFSLQKVVDVLIYKVYIINSSIGPA